MPGKITARWPGRKAEIELHPHPTDSLLVCEECGESCAGDAKAMATFVKDHTERHAGAR
jgi:hypothetical protein